MAHASPIRRPEPKSLAVVDTERPLPHNQDAERSILGAVLLDNFALNAAIEKVSSEDFFLTQHRVIYRRMVHMANGHQAIDIVTLIEDLNKHGELEAAGGVACVSQLADGLPRVSNVGYYARIVKEKASLRNLIHAAAAIQEQAFGSDDDADVILDRSESIITGVTRRADDRFVVVSSDKLLAMDIKRREMLLDPIIATQSITQVYSFRGVGKTYFVLGLTTAVASGSKFLKWTAAKPKRVLYIDGELPAAVLQERVNFILRGSEKQPEPDYLRFLTPDLQPSGIPDLSTPEGQAAMMPVIRGTDLLVLDNLSTLCKSGVENEAESWTAMQSWLLRLRREGIATLFVHHAGKNQTQRGTSRREDVLDTVIALRRPQDYQQSEGMRAEIVFEKCRTILGKHADPFEVRLERDEKSGAIWTMRGVDDVELLRASELFGQGFSVSDVRDEMQISRSKAGRLRQAWAKAKGRSDD